MSKATRETLNKVHKPFDFVESKKGSFGYVQEVNINECQEGFDNQVSYAINWVKNVDNEHNAWWNHNDLKVIGNMFKEISKCAVHPFGNNEEWIDKIM